MFWQGGTNGRKQTTCSCLNLAAGQRKLGGGKNGAVNNLKTLKPPQSVRVSLQPHAAES